MPNHPITPAVSILMPVRNEERFLPAALDSISRQTLQTWELIAVDDGSTDATPTILAAAAEADPRIRVLSTNGQGLVPALNMGLAACCAPLVARMDGDDISHPARLAEQATFLAGNGDVGLVACSFRHFPCHAVGSGMAAYEQWQSRLMDHDAIMTDRCVESPFVHPSVMFRRSCVEAVGGYRDRGWPEDYDLWLRLAAAGTDHPYQPLLYAGCVSPLQAPPPATGIPGRGTAGEAGRRRQGGEGLVPDPARRGHRGGGVGGRGPA